MRAVGKSFSERKCTFRRGDRQEQSGQKLEELPVEPPGLDRVEEVVFPHPHPKPTRLLILQAGTSGSHGNTVPGRASLPSEVFMNIKGKGGHPIGWLEETFPAREGSQASTCQSPLISPPWV